MIWKTIILLSCALCVFGDGHYAVSKQRIKINQREQTGEIVQTGAQPEHHDGYAWSYPAYEFSYEVHDPHTHDKKGQEEKRDGDEVRGEYWLVQPDGRKRTVTYDADNHKGFNAIVHYSNRHHHEQNRGNRNQGNRNEGNQRQEERGEQENSGEVRDEGGNEQQQRAPERGNESQRQAPGRRNEQQRQGPGRGIEQQRQGPGRGNEQQRQGPGRGNEQQRQGPGRGIEQQRQGPGRGNEQQRQGPGRGNEQQRQGPGRGNEQQRQEPGRENEELRQGPNRGNVELRQGPVRGNEQEQRAPGRGNEQQQGAPVREIEEIEEGGYEGQGESLEEIQRGEITRWGYGPRWEERPTRIQETGRNNQEQPRENSDARVGEGPRNANNYRQQEIDVMSILNNAGNSGLIRGNQREVQQRWYNEERRQEENNEETGEAEGNRRAPEQRNFDERRAVPSLETPYYGRPAIHPRFLKQNSRRN